MKGYNEPVEFMGVDSYSKHGLMIEKEFLIFNKPIISNMSNVWQPPTDVYEKDDNIVVKMDIGGVNCRDINISLEDNVLKVTGSRADNFAQSRACFHQMEIRYGQFERKIDIPKPFKKDSISASYSDGFLVLIFPKSNQRAISHNLPMKIEI